MAGVCCSSVGELWRMVLARLGWLVCVAGVWVSYGGWCWLGLDG